MGGTKINRYTDPDFLRQKALKVLELAKAQEAKALSKGKKYVQIDAKTRVLRR